MPDRVALEIVREKTLELARSILRNDLYCHFKAIVDDVSDYEVLLSYYATLQTVAGRLEALIEAGSEERPSDAEVDDFFLDDPEIRSTSSLDPRDRLQQRRCDLIEHLRSLERITGQKPNDLAQLTQPVIKKLQDLVNDLTRKAVSPVTL